MVLVVHVTVYGMLRIKDEARWIEQVLAALLPACERIFVFDDHSTDETPDICRRTDQVEFYESEFAGLDEARDKNYLIERVEEVAVAGDWIVSIDGDEEIERGGCDKIRRLAKDQHGPNAYSFRVLYLWDRPDQIRTDRWYATYARPSMFRLNPGVRFGSRDGAGFHCGNVPQCKNHRLCDVRLLHYGYMHREDRLRKYAWYNAPDKQPIPPREDGYRHMVIGDLFPAETVTRYAGPLKLEPYRQ